MQLKSLFLTYLALSSLALPNKTHSMELSGKNIAIAACATIAGVAISKATYDYFFSLTDEQEFSQAMQLCEECEELISWIDRSYESTVSYSSLKLHHPYMPYHNQVWLTISSGNTRYPFLAYVSTLGKTIKELAQYEDKVNQTRAHISERRIQLAIAIAQADCAQAIKMKSAIEGYDFAIHELQSISKNLKSRRKDVQKIQQHVTTSTQYIIEQQQARIEELEKKLCNSYLYAIHSPTPTWYYTPQPTRHIHVHNTHTTHVTNTIHQDSVRELQDDAYPDMHAANACAAPIDAPQPSAPSLQDVDIKKKIRPVQTNTMQEDDNWRDRLADIGDNFNG